MPDNTQIGSRGTAASRLVEVLVVCLDSGFGSLEYFDMILEVCSRREVERFMQKRRGGRKRGGSTQAMLLELVSSLRYGCRMTKYIGVKLVRMER